MSLEAFARTGGIQEQHRFEGEKNPFDLEGVQHFSGRIIQIKGRVRNLPVGWDGKRYVIELDNIRGENRIMFYTAHADRKKFAALRAGQRISGTFTTSHYGDRSPQDSLHTVEAFTLVSVDE